MAVLQFAKTLTAGEMAADDPRFRIRTFDADRDIPAWLELRRGAFANVSPGVRAWTADDLRREILDKPWFRPDWMWLAEAIDSPAEGLAGSVTLALRGTGPAAAPAIHWLMVAPQQRRRRLGQHLLASAEVGALVAGYRRIVLETHAGWTAAVSLYRKAGYVSA
jgi:GNAT superfamily N-acetyltransferase